MLNLAKVVLKTLPGTATYVQKVEAFGLAFSKDSAPAKNVELVPDAKYGGVYSVTLLTGATSIGIQGAKYVKNLFKAAKMPVTFEHIQVGPKMKQPMEHVVSVMRNRNAIHIDIQHDPVKKHKALLLNSELDLYACIIKMNSLEGFKCRHPGTDIIVVIQNNSGDFSKLEYEPVPGIVKTLKNSQDQNTYRYLKFVYNFAIKNCRSKITFGLKEDELPISDGAFKKIARAIYQDELSNEDRKNLDIEFIKINEMVRWIVMNPHYFDIICTSDRYGTFIASTCAAVCGGASLFSACECGDHHAVFKPLQTKLSLTDCRVLSPYGIVRTSVDLLEHLGQKECAEKLFRTMLESMLDRNIRTDEYGGSDTPDFIICDIINNMKSN